MLFDFTAVKIIFCDKSSVADVKVVNEGGKEENGKVVDINDLKVIGII